MSHLRPNQRQSHPELEDASRTNPPGLGSIGGDVAVGGLAAQFERGVSLRGFTTSAPPPPGFVAAPDQRDSKLRLDLARGLLIEGENGGSSLTNAPALGRAQSGGTDGAGELIGTRIREDLTHQGSSALLSPSELMEFGTNRALSAPLDVISDESGRRSTSFANLAAALGEGLAECMDDSLQKQQQQQQQQQQRYATNGVDRGGHLPSVSEQQRIPTGTTSLQSAASRTGEMDNFARQSRHTASRFVGSSSGARDLDLRYSSATGTTVMPARMIAPRDGHMSGDGHLSQQRYVVRSTSPMIPAPTSASEASKIVHEASSSGNNSPHIVHYAHHVQAPLGVTVTEPASGKNTPQLMALMHGQHRGASPAIIDSSGRLVINNTAGRASAPPSVVIDSGVHEQVVPAPSHLPSATELSSSREQSPHPSAVVAGDGGAIDRALLNQAEVELTPFLWDAFGNDGGPVSQSSSSRTPSPLNKTSRSIAILHAAALYIPDVRSTCEAFGALLSFRPEFCKSRGVIFVSYHDLRSARYAAVELRACLKRLATPRGSTVGDKYDDVQVQYCVPLNASAANDESIIVVSNLPGNFDEESLKADMTSYGAVRGVSLGEDGRSFVVEFYDIQDAKQAVLELESTQPWGTDTLVSVGVRHASERKQGQELLALVGRWRKEASSRVAVGTTVNLAAGASPSPLPSMEAYNPRTSSAPSSASPASQNSDSAPPSSSVPGATMSTVSSSSRHGPTGAHTQPVVAGAASQYAHPGSLPVTTQLVVGPDGQYSYVVVNQPHGHGVSPAHPHHHAYVNVHPHHQPVQQQIVHGPHGSYVTSVPTQVYHSHHAHPHVQPHYQHHLPPGAVITTPYGYPAASVPVYTHAPVHAAAAGTDSSVSSGSAANSNPRHQHSDASSARRQGGHGVASHQRSHENDDESTQLLLDIQAVESGRDTRTSLMVRNIPNKYTQKMLLDEFAETGHGSDKMDFFYLPIDFKNKCNRGYAFVNFVDCRDIASFHHRYNGQPWKIFNSDKICDITYARIQGKAAMLKRFQNSALMEKDEDYKPVVFVSSGPDKGKREEFPAPTSSQNNAQPPRSPHTSSLAAAAAAASASVQNEF